MPGTRRVQPQLFNTSAIGYRSNNFQIPLSAFQHNDAPALSLSKEQSEHSMDTNLSQKGTGELELGVANTPEDHLAQTKVRREAEEQGS